MRFLMLWVASMVNATKKCLLCNIKKILIFPDCLANITQILIIEQLGALFNKIHCISNSLMQIIFKSQRL